MSGSTDPLGRVDRAREALLAAWKSKAAALIHKKMDDAEAHAVKALTDALKKKPDGRPTLRQARSSPSYGAALARLEELLEGLAGHSTSSLDGLVRDAREAFYRASFDLWRPLVPEELLASSDPKPTDAALTAARRIVLHGYELRLELAGPIDGAKRTLLSALTRAGTRSTPEAVESDLLSHWRVASENAITQAVGRALSDSEVRLNVQAGRDLVHDDFLEDVA